MRPVKFRGINDENGEWIYGYLIGDDVIVGEIVEWDSDYFCTEYWWKVDPDTVGQYTGLQDKNGKEIYEGDICNVHTGHKALKADFGVKSYFVRWRETGACFDLIPTKNPEHKIGYTFDNGGVFAVEVIGNIYENPELIKEREENASA